MATIIAGVALVGALALAIYRASRGSKSESGCGGGCAGCSGCSGVIPPYEQDR